jgi:hypothetical protein
LAGLNLKIWIRDDWQPTAVGIPDKRNDQTQGSHRVRELLKNCFKQQWRSAPRGDGLHNHLFFLY